MPSRILEEVQGQVRLESDSKEHPQMACHGRTSKGGARRKHQHRMRQSMSHSARAAEHFYLREDLTRTGAIAANIIKLCVDVGGKKTSSKIMSAAAQSSPPTSSVADAHHSEALDKDNRDSVAQPDEPQSAKSLETKPQVRALTGKDKKSNIKAFQNIDRVGTNGHIGTNPHKTEKR